MRTLTRALPLVAIVVLLVPATAGAWHSEFPRSTNVVPLGESAQPNPLIGTTAQFNSDIAFWRNYAVEGAYDGFRVLDISNPAAPAEVTEVKCGQSQGDVTISPDGNVLVRSQDSARVLPGNDPANACQVGTTAPAGESTTNLGWEGLQIFDFSNKAAPVFVKGVFTDFGSHTHTQYFDRANNRLIIYVNRSGSTNTYTSSPYGGQNWQVGTGCITAVEVPLGNLAASQVVNRCIPAGTNGCHDIGVYEGMKRLYGACRPNMLLYDLSDPVNPQLLHQQQYPGIGGWHSAAMSWNGEYLYAGWEPGGGSAPRCMATGTPLSTTNPAAGNQTDAMKSIFIFRASDGVLLNQWVLPREQSREENCTIHNYAPVPFADRHVLVQGSYQSGSSVIDLTNPFSPREVAWVDPPPLTPTQLGGAWSTHWYNGFIYESDIPRGVAVYDLAEPWWENAVNVAYLNPQTMTERLTCRVQVHGDALRARRAGMAHVRVRVNGQALSGINVTLRGAGVRKSLQTNRAGEAMTRVRPARAGTIRVTASELNVPTCAATRRVAPPRGGVAGGGAGLTGRPA